MSPEPKPIAASSQWSQTGDVSKVTCFWRCFSTKENHNGMECILFCLRGEMLCSTASNHCVQNKLII